MKDDTIKRIHTYESQWHLDKRVPIVLIFTLIGQLGLGLIMGTLMWAQVQSNRETNLRQDQAISNMLAVQHQVIRIQGDVSHMKNDMGEMNQGIKDLTEQLKKAN